MTIPKYENGCHIIIKHEKLHILKVSNSADTLNEVDPKNHNPVYRPVQKSC